MVKVKKFKNLTIIQMACELNKDVYAIAKEDFSSSRIAVSNS